MTDEYPVDYLVEPPIGPRNRLTVAFRPVLAIPHVLLVGSPGAGGGGGAGSSSGVLGAVGAVCAIINWFMIVFTGRAIAGLVDLQRFYLRWRANVLAYEALLRDEYPPFGDSPYPAVTLTLPEPMLEKRNRWTVGFRIVLIIPQIIVFAVLLIAWLVTALIGWFAVLFTGSYPDSLWRFGEGVMRWGLRLESYMLLLHDRYPPFSLQPSSPSPPPPPAA
jgi:hypothetical protein